MRSPRFHVSGNIVDVVNQRIFSGQITVENGKISRISASNETFTNFILPGLVDSHVHIESSMLVPSEFARMAVVHGTTAVVSDPHEIANVCGLGGVRFMIENGKTVPFKFFFGAPSCVPATSFETSGNVIGASEVAEMLEWEEIHYLSEMMNFPGVLFNDPEVKAKLRAARNHKKVIDGHAPGLRGAEAATYAGAGISTDHECYDITEAREKISLGMKILIREGSAARNFDELIPLLAESPEMIMFCSDDKHPDDLIIGHINSLIIRAVDMGYDIIDVLRACTLNPANHYRLNIGLLQPGDPADLIVVDSLEKMTIRCTYVNGIKVAENGVTLIQSTPINPINRFEATPISPEVLSIAAESTRLHIIEALDGQIITRKKIVGARIEKGAVVCDPDNDLLKIVVMNRYHPSPPSVGFITGFGLKKGAIASTVAHDSHNIIAVGVDDHAIANAINLVIAQKGGIAFYDGVLEKVLPLPVAGLMAVSDGFTVSEKYAQLDKLVKQHGSTLSAPFMTLSFMALLVIPELKLSDKGIFDSSRFEFIRLFV